MIRKGVFTAEQLANAGKKIYPTIYAIGQNGVITVSMAGLVFKKSGATGFSGCTEPTALSYIYAWKQSGSAVTLYKTDCLTLVETEVGRFSADPSGKLKIKSFVSYNNKDYLGAEYPGGVILLRVSDGKLDKIDDGYSFGPDNKIDSNRYAVILDNTVYFLSESGLTSYNIAKNKQIVGIDRQGIAVLYHVAGAFGIIEGFKIENDFIAAMYRINLSNSRINPGLPLITYRLSKNGYAHFYGEGGLFTAPNETFSRVSDKPVLQVSGLLVSGGSETIILSHEAGSTAGTLIYKYKSEIVADRFVHTEQLILGNSPKHGINIKSIKGMDTAVFMFGNSGAGADVNDVYTYRLQYNNPSGKTGIIVESYKAGNPAIAFSKYKEDWYIQQEQARLNAAGYSPNN